jgi:CHAD domain-containing protein
MESNSTTIIKRLWASKLSVIGRLPTVLAGFGLRIEPAGRTASRNLHLDTDDWWLLRAGAACSIQLANGEANLILEPLKPTSDIPIDAEHFVELLPEAPETSPDGLPGRRLHSFISPLVGDKTFDVQLELHRTKAAYNAFAAGGATLSATAASVRVSRKPNTTASFAEITLSMSGEHAEELDRIERDLCSRLDLKPIKHSSIDIGLETVGIHAPAFVESTDLTITPDDRLVDAAYKVFRRQYERMVWNEPGTRLGIDAEYLHDMRVATRRLRAATRMFRRVFPRARLEGIGRNLKWLGGVLGQVRDLDVYLVHLKDEVLTLEPRLQEPLELYLNNIGAHREQARASLLGSLKTIRFASFVERFGTFLDTGPPPMLVSRKAQKPAATEGRNMILKRLKTLLQAGRSLTSDAPDTELHQLRISCKRLRYACEFFSDLFNPEATEFIGRLKVLQDVLGAHQDAVVARRTLSSFSARITEAPAKRSELDQAIQQLQALHIKQAKETRREFFKLWKEFDRKRVRRPLKDRMAKYPRAFPQ